MAPWPDPSPPPVEPGTAGDADQVLARAAARCFASPEGRRLLAWLSRRTLERALGPEAGEAALWTLEGQRALVLALFGLIRRGQGRPLAPLVPLPDGSEGAGGAAIAPAAFPGPSGEGL